MKKTVTWIVIADGGRARIVTHSTPNGAYENVLGSDMIADMNANVDLVSDRPGRTHDRNGQGRHAMEPPSDPHRTEKAKLAHRVADLLDEKRKKGAFDRLIIVASPQTLGDLRQAFAASVKDAVVEEVGKDLTRLTLAELSDTLPDLLDTVH